MVNKTIKIGTRDSELALWQAKTVEKLLNDLGYKTQIVAVKSQGDLLLDKPLYELGITGIFTKTLDIAMINGEIDIAVHSMKDVPTALPIGMMQAAVLKRANEKDILVYNNNLDFLDSEGTIATGSLRRQAMWLNKYPNHKVVDLRGNVNTRMQKLKDNNWNGAIFAAAGLERINIKPENFIDLNWMIPAPAQGAMVIHAMQKDEFCKVAVAELNNLETDICTYIERQFLKTLEGGCTAPIGALATFDEDEITFKGALLSIDGKQKIEVDKVVPIQEWKKLGYNLAQEILSAGGTELMTTIKNSLKK
ncbi:hydroxymethylbilane synthase [Flavobacterium sp.]|uniref:hydroxymethylbilane synthase n=1 Tax=Flavobacterium sp. TaxID=239 RepID=UPI00286D7488|nr:hydroxymethylbilane synthase [Flavobacterium sp.]